MGSLSNTEVGRKLEAAGPTSSVAGAFTRHCETTVTVPATPEATFSFLDDHARLSSHMSKRSWMMAGSRMSIEMDDAQGRSIGSRIRLSGRILGLHLSVDEVVTERNPPARKVWRTTVPPRLLIIGSYRMGFNVQQQSDKSRLLVFIDYALPEGVLTRWLGRAVGGLYAQWCTNRMANDAAAYFAAVRGE
jgi:hypothetical protein